MYNFWIWVWVAAWIVGFIMWGLFLTAIFRWSAKKAKKDGKGEFPRQIQYNVPLEMVLTIVPILIIMGLFFFTVQTQQKVTALDKDPKVVVDVTAFQWNWKFGYAENHVNGENYDGADKERQAEAEKSAHDPEGIDNPNPIHGKSMGDLSYLNYNKIETVGTTEEVPVLVLPSDTAIEFRLASGDVSHASGYRSSCLSATSTHTQRQTLRSVASRWKRLRSRAHSLVAVPRCAVPTTR